MNSTARGGGHPATRGVERGRERGGPGAAGTAQRQRPSRDACD
jgi:hypothetical protein